MVNKENNLLMAFIFIAFVFIGLHLFFLSIEIGWKQFRLRRVGIITKGIIHHKQNVKNKYYLYYEFMAINPKTNIQFIVTQRCGVSKYTFDDYNDGDIIEIVYLNYKFKDNVLKQDIDENNSCFCYCSIFILTLFSIPWILIPFIWSSVNNKNDYSLDFTAYITFGAAFCLWIVTRVICWKCWRSNNYRIREATEYDLRQFDQNLTPKSGRSEI